MIPFDLIIRAIIISSFCKRSDMNCFAKILDYFDLLRLEVYILIIMMMIKPTIYYWYFYIIIL